MVIKEYCPYCLRPLDSMRSCWIGGTGCEYEADNHLPGYAPLNDKQRLERKRDIVIERIAHGKKYLTQQRKMLTDINVELDKLT